jgi:hypothetical protein
MTERYAFINHFNFLSIESFITEAVWSAHSWFSAVPPGHDTDITTMTIDDGAAAWTISRASKKLNLLKPNGTYMYHLLQQ